MKRALIVLSLSIGIIVSVLLLAPVSISREQAKKISGMVTSVYEAGTKDAVFKVSGANSTFYINRAFEHTFNLASLRDKLLGKQVTILYADSWTPFDPGCSKHISEMALGDQLLYSELK